MCDLDGVCDVWEEATPRARKDHRCDACGESISAGSEYSTLSTLYDGSWERIKRCARCYRMWEVIDSAARDAGEYLGANPRMDCGLNWSDVHDGSPPEELARLAFALPGEVSLND